MNNFYQIKLTSSIVSYLFIVTLIFLGCGGNHNYQPDVFLDAIADTIFQDDGRQVFIADGTGGYYFDDAFRVANRSEYGYSIGERKILSTWSLLDGRGVSLVDNPKYTVVHPERIEYHYANGLITTITTPMGISGLLIKFYKQKKSSIIFRPQIDMRRLSVAETPTYTSDWDSVERRLLVSREDQIGGWVAIQAEQEINFESEEKTFRQNHDLSRSIGSVDVSTAWSPGEFQLDSGKQLTIRLSWGKDQEEALANLSRLAINLDSLNAQRQSWALSVLETIKIECEDHQFVKTFAWARLITAQLIVKSGEDQTLFTGIPFDPHPHGFHTCFSLPGLRNVGFSDENVISTLKTLVSYQNIDLVSNRYGMMPGAITEDGAQYNVPEIAGMVSYVLEKLRTSQSLDSINSMYFGSVLAKSIIGTARFRIKYGLVYSRADEYLLHDSQVAVDRTGVTIESQVFLRFLMEYLSHYPQIELLDPGLSEVMRSGVGNLFKRKLTGDLVGVGKAGEYLLPILKGQLIGPFLDPITKDWVDLVRMEEDLFFEESSSDFSEILARYLYKQNNIKWSRDILEDLIEAELIGHVGLRSLSPLAKGYQSEHEYILPNSLGGTQTAGDVYVWSCGILADTYYNVRKRDQAYQLLDRLNHRVLNQGVTGALPEAEQPETGSALNSIIGNSIFLSSNAEYLRLITRNMFRVSRSKGRYFAIQLDFPSSWGKTKLVLQTDIGFITINRLEDYIYSVTQEGIYPDVGLSFRIITTTNESVLASTTLREDEMATINFEQQPDGHWMARVEVE